MLKISSPDAQVVANATTYDIGFRRRAGSVRPNDAEIILQTQGFWKIGADSSDKHSGRCLSGVVRGIVIDGLTISTVQPASFEEPPQELAFL